MSLTRDAEYYREDGDLVVRVEDTLFRIDKGVLKKEPSTFTDMFKMPRPDGQIDGEDDDHPLVLNGDTVQEFRALCWIGYILPGQVPTLSRDAKSTTDEVSNLLSLAIIAHKYLFAHLEDWAYTFVEHFCMTRNKKAVKSDSCFLVQCSAIDFDRLLQYAVISKRVALLAQLKKILLSRLDSDPPTLALVEALCVGEKYEWMGFQADVYYRIVCRMSEAASSTEDLASLFSNFSELSADLFSPGLTDNQRSRAMRGYICLNVKNDQIMRTLFKDANPTSLHFPAQWQNRAAVDIIGRLQDIKQSSSGYNIPGVPHSSIGGMLAQINGALPSYFFGPKPSNF